MSRTWPTSMRSVCETGGDTSAKPVRNPTSLLNLYDAKLGMTFLLFGDIQLWSSGSDVAAVDNHIMRVWSCAGDRVRACSSRWSLCEVPVLMAMFKTGRRWRISLWVKYESAFFHSGKCTSVCCFFRGRVSLWDCFLCWVTHPSLKLSQQNHLASFFSLIQMMTFKICTV